jgi:hypothetical protein
LAKPAERFGPFEYGGGFTVLATAQQVFAEFCQPGGLVGRGCRDLRFLQCVRQGLGP